MERKLQNKVAEQGRTSAPSSGQRLWGSRLTRVNVMTSAGQVEMEAVAVGPGPGPLKRGDWDEIREQRDVA